MATGKTRKRLFERLKQGLEEGIAFSKGELSLRTVEIRTNRRRLRRRR